MPRNRRRAARGNTKKVQNSSSDSSSESDVEEMIAPKRYKSWEKVFDEDSNQYYYANRETSESRWDRPTKDEGYWSSDDENDEVNNKVSLKSVLIPNKLKRTIFENISSDKNGINILGTNSGYVLLDLKNYKVNKHRETYGWTSNNSIFAELGMDYTEAAKRIVDNGEPGFAWLENMRQYSRMKNGGDNKDHRAMGGNPCLEQTLESYELCCLVETFPNNHDDFEDYARTLKYAYLYAKTVTLGKTHWSDTNRVMLRNRRIGCSVSGVAQFVTNRGLDSFKEWLNDGYDTIQKWDNQYSDWFAVPKSIKTTSVKPSGTVSLLAGATPGLHYPESRFYIRRIRVSKHSELLEPMIKAGYKVEPAFGSEDTTMVVEVPVDVGEGIRTVSELSIWEQFSLAAFLQRHWADNQVSCTVTFDPEREGGEIPQVLNYYQYHLKGISLLPRHELGAYKQMPYESIDEKEYNKQVKKLGKLSFGVIKHEEAEVDKFCNNDSCEIIPTTGDNDDQDYAN